MAGRLKTTPRKLPRQDRSKETVEALLEATARVLIQEGYESTSTNKIALKAGVSIGSLYQYFPNKESLIAALIDRHYADMARICREALDSFGDAPVAVLIRETVKAMVAIHALNPRLHRVLKEQVPRIGKLKKLNELHSETTRMVQAVLERRGSDVRVRDARMASFMIVETVDALLHSTLVLRREEFGLEIVIDEITALLLSYLTRRDVARARDPMDAAPSVH